MAKKRVFRKEPTLRSTRIILLLSWGAKLTTMDIAKLTELSYWGARSMMEVIESSHHVPLVYLDGYWQIPRAWDMARRDWFDTSKLDIGELQQLLELTMKMLGKSEVTATAR